jgi:hypothetical protein
MARRAHHNLVTEDQRRTSLLSHRRRRRGCSLDAPSKHAGSAFLYVLFVAIQMPSNARQASRPTSEDAGSAEPAAIMPRNVAMPVIKRYQALFLCVAHSEVRQSGTGGTLSTREQETIIEESYKRHLRLWYADSATLLQNTNFPVCPPAMKAVGSVDVFVRTMMSTTGRGSHSHTGVSLLRKWKDQKKDMLKLIADWNMLCGCTIGSSEMGAAPTGTSKVAIYQRLVETHYRKEETARVLKLRLACAGVDFANSALCTPENIRAARFSYHYATRGYTKANEDADIRSYRRLQAHGGGQPQIRGRPNLYAQIEALVNADETLHAQQSSAPNEGEARAPAQATTANQNFSEAPMPAQFDIELGLAFKVFGPYEGPSYMSPFWTQAWNEFRPGNSFAGRRTTQHRQNAQASVAAQGDQPGAFPGATPASLVPSASTARNNEPQSRADQRAAALVIYASMRDETLHANALERFRIQQQLMQQRISNLQSAIAIGTAMGAAYPIGWPALSALHTEYMQLMSNPCPEPPAPSPSSVLPAVNFSLDRDDGSSRRQRRRHDDSAADAVPVAVDLTLSDGPEAAGLPQLLRELFADFTGVECGDGGDCAFACMNALENRDVSHERLASVGIFDTTNNPVDATRARVVNHLQQSVYYEENSSVPHSRIELYGVDIVGDLLFDCASVEEYCEQMREPGRCGGLNEFAVWSDLMHVRITIHSTASYGGRMHIEQTGLEQYNGEETPNYHVLHIAGYGGRGAMFACLILCYSHACAGGHYQLLLPIIAQNIANNAECGGTSAPIGSVLAGGNAEQRDAGCTPPPPVPRLSIFSIHISSLSIFSISLIAHRSSITLVAHAHRSPVYTPSLTLCCTDDTSAANPSLPQ